MYIYTRTITILSTLSNIITKWLNMNTVYFLLFLLNFKLIGMI